MELGDERATVAGPGARTVESRDNFISILRIRSVNYPLSAVTCERCPRPRAGPAAYSITAVCAIARAHCGISGSGKVGAYGLRSRWTSAFKAGKGPVGDQGRRGGNVKVVVHAYYVHAYYAKFTAYYVKVVSSSAT